MKKQLLFLLTLINFLAFGQQVVADLTFEPGTGFDQAVHDIIVQPDGKIIACGYFLNFNGTNVNQIARLNPNGSLDLSFNSGSGFGYFGYPGILPYVNSMLLQSDGKVIVTGDFTSYNGINVNQIARLNSNGTLDLTFNSGSGFGGGTSSSLYSMSIQNDGKIVGVGDFSNYNGINANNIVRLNPNGSIDNSFNPGSGFNQNVKDIIIQPDGKLIVLGDFTSYNGVTVNRVVRLTANGSLDPTFNCYVFVNNETISLTSLQSDGKILVSYYSYNGNYSSKIIRLNSDGSQDASFEIIGNGFNEAILSSCVQSNGKIIVGGAFTNFNGTITNRIARFNADGTLDLTFEVGSGFSGAVRNILIQQDERILVSGWLNTFNNSNYTNGITRLKECNSTVLLTRRVNIDILY